MVADCDWEDVLIQVLSSKIERRHVKLDDARHTLTCMTKLGALFCDLRHGVVDFHTVLRVVWGPKICFSFGCELPRLPFCGWCCDEYRRMLGQCIETTVVFWIVVFWGQVYAADLRWFAES